MTVWTEQRIDDEVQMIINQSLNTIAFEPADANTTGVFRGLLSKALWHLQDARVISGYTIDVLLTSNNEIKGSVTYTPVIRVKQVQINIGGDGSVSNQQVDKFKRAMKGI